MTATAKSHEPNGSLCGDLLEALRGLVDLCEKHPAFNKPTNTITVGRMACARAAISKAESASP